MEERSTTIPFCYIRHRDGFPDDEHLSVENKQPVSKEQRCFFERNHQPKMENFQKIWLKKLAKEGLITVYSSSKVLEIFHYLKYQVSVSKFTFVYNNFYFREHVPFFFFKKRVQMK